MGRHRKRGRPKGSSKKKSSAVHPKESLQELEQQKRDIQTLLSSLEDAFSEATIEEANYNELKLKNEHKLKEIDEKITSLGGTPGISAGPEPVGPEPAPEPSPPEQPAPAPQETEPEKPEESEKPKVKEKISGAITVQRDNFEKLKKDLSDRMKDLIDTARSQGNEKVFKDMQTAFERMKAEIERIKAISETTRDSMKTTDEKVQRVSETVGELRSLAHQMDSGFKDQEVKVEKMVDVTDKLEPEKLLMELSKRDQKINQFEMRIEKMEGMIKTMNDIMKKSNRVLANIGSLESVINVSKEVSRRMHDMDAQINSVEKINDKLHGMFVDLSNKMEEWVFYRTKQDKIETMVEEILKNFENMNQKLLDYVTKDDLEAFKATVQAAPLPAPETSEMSSETMDLIAQREEINSLMKSMEDEVASGALSKAEYDKIKEANAAKLAEIEKKIESSKAAQPAAPAPAAPAAPASPPATPPAQPQKPAAPAQTAPAAPAEVAQPEKPVDQSVKAAQAVQDVKEELQNKPKRSVAEELEDMLKKGFISQKAYDKAKKAITNTPKPDKKGV